MLEGQRIAHRACGARSTRRPSVSLNQPWGSRRRLCWPPDREMRKEHLIGGPEVQTLRVDAELPDPFGDACSWWSARASTTITSCTCAARLSRAAAASSLLLLVKIRCCCSRCDSSRASRARTAAKAAEAAVPAVEAGGSAAAVASAAARSSAWTALFSDTMAAWREGSASAAP